MLIELLDKKILFFSKFIFEEEYFFLIKKESNIVEFVTI